MAGLYVHIPFCGTKCAYCDFYSTRPGAGMMARLVDALLEERRIREGEPGAVGPDTLYIGGGTPSLLPAGELARLVAGLVGHAGSLAEATVEANPEDVTPAWAGAVAAAGIGRVSLGIQSLDDAELRYVGRRHDSRRALQALELLQQRGLEVSGDLIYGLPGQDRASWLRSLTGLIATGIPHISCYSLGIEPRTRLDAMRRAGRYTPLPDDTVAAMYALLCDRMSSAGYDHYEISNFALPGHRALHNSRYWDLTPYLGLGPGAHSFDGAVRRSNAGNLREYLGAIACGRPYAAVEEETAADRVNDYIITALRRREGLDTADMARRFGPAEAGALARRASRYVASGQMLDAPEGALRFTEEAWFVSDGILVELMA